MAKQTKFKSKIVKPKGGDELVINGTEVVVDDHTTKFRAKSDGRFTSKYDPKYGEEIVRMSQMGYSLNAIAGHIGISRRTLDLWRQKHPEFAELCENAKFMRQYSWETTLIEAESGPKVQAASLSLRAMDVHTFNDRRQLDVVVENKHTFDMSKLSAEELRTLIAIQERQEQAQIVDVEYEMIEGA